MSTPMPLLFRGLVDDAAMFPPGNASAEDALQEHLRYRNAWFADLIGPLLLPARAFDRFTDAHRDSGSPPVAVVLIGTTDTPDDVPANVIVAGFEVLVRNTPLPTVPDRTSLAAEIELGSAGERVLRAVAAGARAGQPRLAKFRTGGTTPDAFRSEDELAWVIRAASSLSAPLKLTAGLHHAVRFTDDATGFEHHGFLNVLVAAARAMAGAELSSVSEALAVRSPAPLVEEIRRLDPDQVEGVRSRFVSFGCCGVEDPVNDLVALGLVEEQR